MINKALVKVAVTNKNFPKDFIFSSFRIKFNWLIMKSHKVNNLFHILRIKLQLFIKIRRYNG